MNDVAMPNVNVPALPGGTARSVQVEGARDSNPAGLGFPATLPLEIALQADTIPNICAAYGIDREHFAALIQHPVFIKAYQEAVEMLKVEGMSFKIKCRLLAEAYLGDAFKLVKSPATSDAVRADLIKNTVRWAGYDAKAAEVGQASNFNILINLS